MIDKNKSPMEFHVGIYNKCPYCKKYLNLIDSKTFEKNYSKYLFCSKCEKMFELLKNLSQKGIAISVFQLTSLQIKEFMERFPERFESGGKK